MKNKTIGIGVCLAFAGFAAYMGADYEPFLAATFVILALSDN